MSCVDLTDQFYSTTVFCVKVSSGQRNSLCIASTPLYSMHTFSTRNIQTAKNALAVQDRTSKAHVQQCMTTAMGNCAGTRPCGLSPLPG